MTRCSEKLETNVSGFVNVNAVYLYPFEHLQLQLYRLSQSVKRFYKTINALGKLSSSKLLFKHGIVLNDYTRFYFLNLKH